MSLLGSLCTECAKETRVPAGGALAVDREKFSLLVAEKIRSHPLIKIETCEVTDIPEGNVIIAAGPLASEPLAQKIKELCGGSLSFLIAIILFGKGASPILDGTIDLASVVMKILVSQESSLGSIASSVLTGAIHVDSFALGGAVFGPMIMLFATAIWEIAYYVTLPADQKPKRKSREKITA